MEALGRGDTYHHPDEVQILTTSSGPLFFFFRKENKFFWLDHELQRDITQLENILLYDVCLHLGFGGLCKKFSGLILSGRGIFMLNCKLDS